MKHLLTVQLSAPIFCKENSLSWSDQGNDHALDLVGRSRCQESKELLFSSTTDPERWTRALS